jgi:integrase
VDFVARTINVRGENAKSSQSRPVPLSPRAESTLQAWRKQVRGQGRVFPRATPDALKGQWARLLADAKITGLRWHDLRHTFGSRTALAGASIEVLKKLMGHSSITTTSRYLHSDMEDARRAIDAMAKTTGTNIVAFPKGDALEA